MNYGLLRQDDKGYLAMVAVAATLTAISPKRRYYSLCDTWMDYGAGIEWTTIHYFADDFGCHGVQILSPRQWEMVTACETAADIAAAVEDIINGEWFSDK